MNRCFLSFSAVIAIISILAAMLLPALGKARDKARSITCVSNLKQFGLGMTMYADGNDGYFPVANLLSDNPHKFGADLLCAQKFLNDKSKRCPILFGYSTYDSTQVYGTQRWNEGALNGPLQQYIDGNGKFVFSIILPGLKSPSAAFIASDSGRIEGGKVYQSSTFFDDNPACFIHFRHSQRANYVCGDGSAHSGTKDEVANALRASATAAVTNNFAVPFRYVLGQDATSSEKIFVTP